MGLHQACWCFHIRPALPCLRVPPSSGSCWGADRLGRDSENPPSQLPLLSAQVQDQSDIPALDFDQGVKVQGQAGSILVPCGGSDSDSCVCFPPRVGSGGSSSSGIWEPEKGVEGRGSLLFTRDEVMAVCGLLEWNSCKGPPLGCTHTVGRVEWVVTSPLRESQQQERDELWSHFSAG